MYREPEIVFRNVGIVAWAAGMIGLLWAPVSGTERTAWPLVILAGVLLLGMGVAAVANVGGVRQQIAARWGSTWRLPSRRFGVFESLLLVLVGAGWLVAGLAEALR